MAAGQRSFEECVAAVDAAGKIGKQRALELLSEVNNRAEAMLQTGVPDRYLRAASDLADMELENARAARLDTLRNVAARTQIMQRAEAEAQGRVAPHISANLIPTNKLTLADGIRSQFHYMPGAQRNDNAEGLWFGLLKQSVSPLMNRLRQLGIEKAALSGAMDRGTREAMWRMNGGTPDPTIIISRNEQAFAEALMAPMRLLKERQNALGAKIGDAIDYVTHTLWNSRQLRLAAGPGASHEAAYQAWKARDVPRMAEKTFDGILPREGETMEAARERFIRSIYDATESGVHMGSPNMAGLDSDVGGYIPPAYEGTRNIARAASQQRVVYWKNAQAWGDHMREFGGGESLLANVVRTLDLGARRTALMHYGGTNPEGNFETIAQRLIEQHRTSDELGRLQNQLQGVRNVLGRLTGSLNAPLKEDAGQLTNQLMAAESVMHLGGVGLTHLTAAPATITSEMVHHGVGRIQTVINMITAAGRGTAERQEALADSGAYAHGWTNALQRVGTLGDTWRRDGIPGSVSWIAAHFMRLTGLPQILDSLQANAVKSVLMSRLGRQIERAFDEVEPHMQAGLRAYGIGPEEWSLLRSSSEPSIVEGNRWVTPGDALQSDPAAVEAVLRSRGILGEGAAPSEARMRLSPATIERAVKKFQWELGDKLLMYMNDAADRAVVRPGVRERAIVLGGLRPGGLQYFAARAISQFKMWPLAATAQILGRDIAKSLSGKEMATNLGFLVALSTVGGAMRMAVNDIATGRPQRDYRNPLTLLAALAQGGGLGIYGDFLFGETSRMSTGILSTVGGPIAGDGERLWNLFTRWKADMRTEPGKAMQHMWPDLAHLLVQHIPFANLIYLKGTLDYLLWYHLYEAASPGWWERTNRRLQKEQGRTMIGYRPGAHIPWTPFGIGGR
jgi:hypothetical protein